MTSRLEDALQVCLEALQDGTDLEACLALYPDLAEDLQPLLEAAQQAQATPSLPTAAAMSRSRARFLARAEALRARRSGRLSAFLPLFQQALRPALAAALMAIVGVFLGTRLMSAAAAALPGDTLYPLKRAQETVRISLARDPIEKRQVEEEANRRRAEEVQALLDAGEVREVVFEGLVEAQEPGRWRVAGIPVVLRAETEVVGKVQVGQVARVEGQTRPDGTVLARRILLHSYTLMGLLQQMDDQGWTVEGTRLLARPDTQAAHGLRVGLLVIALVEMDETGTAYALAILPLPTGLPTETPEPEPTPPPPTPTPSPPTPEAAEEIEFTGRVDAMGTSAWVIDGVTVRITGQTEIKDAGIQVGDTVKVHALRTSGGALVAEEIELVEDRSGPGGGEDDDHAQEHDDDDDAPEQEPTEEPEHEEEHDEDEAEKVEFTGVVQSKGGSLWVIGGRQVVVDSETEVKGDPEVGDLVKVKGTTLPDGRVKAEKIERED